MTYKSVLARAIEKEAERWAKKVLQENDIDLSFLNAEKVKVEKDGDNVFWEVLIVGVLKNGYAFDVTAGGTACDMLGICPSVLWDIRKEIIWMASDETRKQLGIEKLRLGA